MYTHKVGGIRFVRIGKYQISLCKVKKKNRVQPERIDDSENEAIRAGNRRLARDLLTIALLLPVLAYLVGTMPS